jgi:hypothetical protein
VAPAARTKARGAMVEFNGAHLRVDGKPFFPLGWYMHEGVTTPQNIKDLATSCQQPAQGIRERKRHALARALIQLASVCILTMLQMVERPEPNGHRRRERTCDERAPRAGGEGVRGTLPQDSVPDGAGAAARKLWRCATRPLMIRRR